MNRGKGQCACKALRGLFRFYTHKIHLAWAEKLTLAVQFALRVFNLHLLWLLEV